MRFIADHDLHIHTQLSLCSGDTEQTPQAILEYGLENGFKTLCLTDHMWDARVPGASEWYQRQPYERIIKSLPLPQAKGVRYLFGCETDLDRQVTLGIAPETLEKLDFCIIPTTHLHMNGFTVEGTEDAAQRARLWVERLDKVLDMDLPFHKIGIAHLTCSLIFKKHYLEVLNLLTDDEYHRLFAKAAKTGVGIELNFPSLRLTEEEVEPNLRPYRIAKAEGCKFYFGSDAHHPADLKEAKGNFEHTIDLLDLKEEDKFAFLNS